MKMVFSKDTHFRWKIKWRPEHFGALGTMGERAPLSYGFTWKEKKCHKGCVTVDNRPVNATIVRPGGLTTIRLACQVWVESCWFITIFCDVIVCHWCSVGEMLIYMNFPVFVDAGGKLLTLDECGVHDITGTLKLYLRELPDPVIPGTVYKQFLSASRKQQSSFIFLSYW